MVPVGISGLIVTIISSVILRDVHQSYLQDLRGDALVLLRDRGEDSTIHEIGFETLSVDSIIDSIIAGQQSLRANFRARHTTKTALRPKRVDYDLTAVREHSFQPWRLLSLTEKKTRSH